jgi:hypothetical protein
MDANRLLDSDRFLGICAGVGLFFGALAAAILCALHVVLMPDLSLLEIPTWPLRANGAARMRTTHLEHGSTDRSRKEQPR